MPNFTSAFNLSQAAAGVSEKALLALPLVLLIIAREIDLSIASILALTSVVLGVLVQAEVPLAAIALPLVLLAAPPAPSTACWSPASICRRWWSRSARSRCSAASATSSSAPARSTCFPDALTNLGIDNVPGTQVPWTIVPFLLLAPVFAVVLQHTPTGRRIYALGGNPDAARYAGVRSRRLRFMLFVVSGLVCALAGIVFTARLANARANNALGFELDVITIALLGGISVFGGRGKLTGVLWALVLVATLRNVLGLMQVGGDAQGIAIGLLLIGSLLLSNSPGAARPGSHPPPPGATFPRPEGCPSGPVHLDPTITPGSTNHDQASAEPSCASALALLAPPRRPSARNAPTEPVTVGFLPKLDTDPYFQVAKLGAEEATGEIGGKVIQQAPSAATADAQIEFINNLVVAEGLRDRDRRQRRQRGRAGAEARRAQGVGVIAYDSDVAPDAARVFMNQAKSDSLAEQMLESMGKLIGYEGEFAILSSTPTATNQNAWVDFMKAKLATEPKFAKMKLVQVAYGEESEQVNQQQALALAQAFPDLKGIIVPAGIGLPAAARALEQAKLIDKIKLTGLAPATFMTKYIKAGQAQDIWWNVQDLGYLTYYAAQAYRAVQDHRQGRRDLRGRPARQVHGRRRRRGRARPGRDRHARERRRVQVLTPVTEIAAGALVSSGAPQQLSVLDPSDNAGRQ